jgi:hypothetical protein
MRFNPFNPQSPARPENFVGREFEMERFEKFLSQTMHNSPMNMCITGNRGIGKTSILIKMDEFAKNNNCLVLRISNYEDNIHDIRELTNSIISNLKNRLYDEKTLEKKIAQFGEWIQSIRPILAYKEFSVSFTTEERKFLAETQLRKNLIEIWNKIENEYSAIVILIDEAEALDRIEGGLSFLREVFQRISHDANYMVVLCGKLNLPEKMSESFSPLCRFFPSYTLSPFDEKETFGYIDKMLFSVNCYATEDCKKKIFRESAGHPYVIVKMCETTFSELEGGRNEIKLTHFLKAQPKIILDLERDFFIPMYHPLTPKAKKIICKLSDLNKLDFSFQEAKEISKMGSSNISPYISEMVRKGCINRPERAKYQFFHKLFLEFIKRKSVEGCM